jgi:hypothetical protein
MTMTPVVTRQQQTCQWAAMGCLETSQLY